MPWADGKFPETGLIEPYTCRCNNGTDVCSSGQSCFWFTQGSSIGCLTADGNGTRLPNLDHCPGERAPDFDPLKIEGALNPKYRTVNVDSKPGSVADIWKFNPWRAPGKAPVADPCGMAGGNTYEVFNAGAYNATKFAKQGDLGTKVLKPRPTGTVWKSGGVERTRWELTAAHGGGYIYQLCPAGSELTEECFASNSLAMAPGIDGGPPQHKVLHNDPSDDYVVNATVVREGGGIGWTLHPILYKTSIPCDWNPAAIGQHCDWHCNRCGAPWWAADGACPDHNCEHTAGLPRHVNYGSAWNAPPINSATIEDHVVVPKVPAGDYVLRWRWDCEASSQIWTTCSDITII